MPGVGHVRSLCDARPIERAYAWISAAARLRHIARPTSCRVGAEGCERSSAMRTVRAPDRAWRTLGPWSQRPRPIALRGPRAPVLQPRRWWPRVASVIRPRAPDRGARLAPPTDLVERGWGTPSRPLAAVPPGRALHGAEGSKLSRLFQVRWWFRMTRGGSRNRSGPQPDPNSGRSERRGYKLNGLPSEGYDGEVPAFPLEPIVLFTEYWDGEGQDREKVKERDEGGTESFRDREAQVWAEAWRTPQACAWSMQSWRWPVVAEYCRLKTAVELAPTSSAALVAQLHRYRDQIGLTPAGLRENGWSIVADEVGAKRDEKVEADVPAPAERPRRLRGV